MSSNGGQNVGYILDKFRLNFGNVVLKLLQGSWRLSDMVSWVQGLRGENLKLGKWHIPHT